MVPQGLAASPEPGISGAVDCPDDSGLDSGCTRPTPDAVRSCRTAASFFKPPLLLPRRATDGCCLDMSMIVAEHLVKPFHRRAVADGPASRFRSWFAAREAVRAADDIILAIDKAKQSDSWDRGV